MKKKLNCILLVDDDDATNYLHQIVLNEADVSDNIFVALNGEEALEFIKNNKLKNQPQPDLIFLDINMPKMNGWEFLEEYEILDSTDKFSSKIFMLTVSANPDDKKKAEKLQSIKGFKNKPLTLDLLNEIVTDFF